VTRHLRCPSEDDTVEAGRILAAEVVPGDCLLLEGDLAAGKTTFTRGLVDGLGGDVADVSSPTFVIVQNYPCTLPVRVVHHVDLYRLPLDPGSVAEIGLEEFLSEPDAVVVVEWPRDAVGHWLPARPRVWSIRFDVVEDGRVLSVTAPGEGAA
jgi:tRNA threonylcarbamoyladenosine biosynthesis protein TsaE